MKKLPFEAWRLLAFKVVKTEEQARRFSSYWQAVEKGRTESVEAFLRQGMDPNWRVWKEFMLTIAARKNQTGVIKALLKAGANPNVDSGAPFYFAATKGNTEALQALLAAGANVHLGSPKDVPALCVACHADNQEIVGLLLKAGANPNKPGEIKLKGTRDFVDVTPLMIAAWLGHVRIAESLLKHGARPDAEDSLGHTALHWARQSRAPGARKIIALIEPRGPRQKGAGSRLPLKADFGAAADKPEFRRAVSGLGRLTRKKPQALQDDDGDVIPGGWAFPLEEKEARALAVKLQRQYQRRGFLVFQTADRRRPALAILPTADKGEAIAAMQTDDGNSKASNQKIVQCMKRLERTQPFLLSGIGFDFLAGRFTSPIRNVRKLAKLFSGICPDAGDEVTLARELKRTGEFFLWWD